NPEMLTAVDDVHGTPPVAAVSNLITAWAGLTLDAAYFVPEFRFSSRPGQTQANTALRGH
ncbi:MAG TPA: hypothetical protein VN639_16685, partial [Azonexus sp.]|nr:hypothetical protein [Azonexus sp.]